MQTDTSPAENGLAIDLSTTDATGFVSRAIIVGTAGTVKVDHKTSGTGITHNLPVGVWPLAVTKIYKTGTSASGLTVVW